MDLKALDLLEKELEFTSFTHQDALAIGNRIVQSAQDNKVAVAVHIERNRVPVFTHLMDGTSEENYEWLFRKNGSLIIITEVLPTLSNALSKVVLLTQNTPCFPRQSIKQWVVLFPSVSKVLALSGP